MKDLEVILKKNDWVNEIKTAFLKNIFFSDFSNTNL